MRTVTLLLAALTLSRAPLAAQRIQPSPFARADLGSYSRTDAARLTGTRVPDEVADAGKMMGGGLLLGAGGLIGGALIGHQFEGSPCEDCILGAFFGALVGESLAIPLGVHLGNGRRGDVGPALAASVGIAAAGLGAAALSRQWGVLLAIPVLQIAASIGIERHTAAGNP
ncbi:MAG: hypothetical protein ACREOQ_05845 [Gemmatimonadales bacterium]